MGDALIPMDIIINVVLFIQRRQGAGGSVALLKCRRLGGRDGNRAEKYPYDQQHERGGGWHGVLLRGDKGNGVASNSVLNLRSGRDAS